MRLLRQATFETVPGGDGGGGVTLCEEGAPLRDLFVVSQGSADVVVGGTVTTTIPPFQVIGEASLLENLQSAEGGYHQPSRATIVARPGARYVRWSQRTFFELQRSDREFARTTTLMIARTLSDKLKSARLQAREAAATVNPEIEIQQLRLELAQTRSDLAATSRELDNYKSRALSAFPRREEV